MNIVLYPSEILRNKSKDVENVHSLSCKMIIKKLIKTLSKTKSGIGLSAPQVGSNINIFIMNLTKATGRDLVFINPKIIEKSEEMVLYREGCLSFPDLYLELESPKWIKIKYLNQAGEEIIDTLDGLAAVCANHEIHHLLGELMIDRVKNK